MTLTLTKASYVPLRKRLQQGSWKGLCLTLPSLLMGHSPGSSLSNKGKTEEGPKIRPIDDYKASRVNSVVSQTEQVPVHSLDVVAAMVSSWMHHAKLAK